MVGLLPSQADHACWSDHAGVQTGMLGRRLPNRACGFRLFLLTVESQQLPGGAGVCCSVKKAFLISGLGCSVHASQLETAEMNTWCRLVRPPAQEPLTAAVGTC